jgi:2-aminobenzoate-CoA ligase
MLKPSLHLDPFTRQQLPPLGDWPVLRFDLPSLQYPERLNCAEALLDRAVFAADAGKTAIVQGDRALTYAELLAEVNRVAHVLVDDLKIVPGARVLLRGPNTPALFVAWLAVMKVGAVAVSTMPLLRERELKQVIDKAQVSVALCEVTLLDALVPAAAAGLRVVGLGTPSCELEELAARKPDDFATVATSQDDVCLIAFTSGTTGEPKAAMHFHRDVMAMCDTFAAHMLPNSRGGVFSGTPPIAFTFGLGALLCFPLYFRATIALPTGSSPAALAECIQRDKVSHVFTSPTGYRSLMAQLETHDLSSLEVCVSAGEQLPRSVSDAWFDATAIRLIDGIGSTEMIHIFLSAAGDDIRAGSTGRPVPGYTARLLDDAGQPIEGPGVGRLAVQGPTGCRYLSDPRQRSYVVDGWNVTGDVFRRDEDGYYWYVARSDDMIVSSGYNIAGPEIEASLLLHPDVAECAVVGWPDADRGQIVKAFVVLRNGVAGDPAIVKALQDHVKQTLAPYKYPRAVEFRSELPRTATGKLQRSALKAPAT